MPTNRRDNGIRKSWMEAEISEKNLIVSKYFPTDYLAILKRTQ